MQANTTLRVPTLAEVLVPKTGILTDAILIVGFALFTAVFAQIAIKFPGTPVPITGQTLAVLVAGGALGSKRGAASMAVYMLMGMFMPVFAPGSAFLAEKTVHFVLPWNGTDGMVWNMASGGYVVGFILGAYVVGLLAERGWDRGSKISLGMVIGNLSIYIFGLAWLGYFVAFNSINGELTFYEAMAGSDVLDKTLRGGLYPFIGGDALKLLVASMVLPGAWHLVNKTKGKS
ncbi:MAG: biotin transporter BioY [SAR202 cluster bacterium]|nr:biotin transporter BioY [SAR202 cluster bacterium]